MLLLPLHMIGDGRTFRMPGKEAIFYKLSNLATLDKEMYKDDGQAYTETRPACRCRMSNGRIFLQDWFFMVEEV